MKYTLALSSVAALTLIVSACGGGSSDQGSGRTAAPDSVSAAPAAASTSGEEADAPSDGEPSDELSPEQEAEIHDAGLEFARCMREKGFDVPDPVGGMFDIKFDEKVDPDVENEAIDACYFVFDGIYD